MKHIAYISAEYQHNDLPSAGGIGSFVKLMANSLIENGWTVTVFLVLRKKDTVWYDGEIRIVEITGVKPSYISVFKNRLRIAQKIKSFIRKDQISIIEAPDWEGLQAFCNFKIPLITRVHGSVSYFNHLEGIKKSKVIHYLEKKSLNISDHIIAVSNYAGKLTKVVFGFKNFKYNVIYNGVDINRFTPKYKEATAGTKILYFGTLVRKKGVLELAHIFNELIARSINVELILIGKDAKDGVTGRSTWELLQELFSIQAKDKVTYKSSVPYHEMHNAIAKSDICVFPSFAEAFPISWLEAMSMGKPIVASSIGWAKEAIENEKSGLLEHPENHSVFASKIVTIIENPNMGIMLGTAARKRVETHFNQEIIVRKNIEFYNSIIAV